MIPKRRKVMSNDKSTNENLDTNFFDFLALANNVDFIKI